MRGPRSNRKRSIFARRLAEAHEDLAARPGGLYETESTMWCTVTNVMGPEEWERETEMKPEKPSEIGPVVYMVKDAGGREFRVKAGQHPDVILDICGIDHEAIIGRKVKIAHHEPGINGASKGRAFIGLQEPSRHMPASSFSKDGAGLERPPSNIGKSVTFNLGALAGMLRDGNKVNQMLDGLKAMADEEAKKASLSGSASAGGS